MPCCPYHNYYVNQAGSGIGKIYRGTVYQRGHGIGSFLSGLFRSVLPLFKSGARAFGEEVLKTGSNILNDVTQNKPIAEAFKMRISEAGRKLTDRAKNKINQMVGSGCLKRKRKSKNIHKRTSTDAKKSKRYKITQDIFN